jgi:hypothetical protein
MMLTASHKPRRGWIEAGALDWSVDIGFNNVFVL